MMYLKKKGLSDVVATVLIILLALAAVVIVWSFVSPSLRNSGTQIDVQSKCLATELKPTSCTLTADDATANVELSRGDAPQLMKLMVEDSEGAKTVTATAEDAPQELYTTKSVSADLPAGAHTPYKVSAIAVFTVDGNNYDCMPSTTTITCQAAA